MHAHAQGGASCEWDFFLKWGRWGVWRLFDGQHEKGVLVHLTLRENKVNGKGVFKVSRIDVSVEEYSVSQLWIRGVECCIVSFFSR